MKIVKIIVKEISANPIQPFQVKIVKMKKIMKSRIANTPPSPKVKIVKIVVKQMSVNPTHPYQVKIVKIVKSRKANTSNQFRNSRKYRGNLFYDLVLLCIFFCPTPGGFYEVPFLSIQHTSPLENRDHTVCNNYKQQVSKLE